VARMVHSVKNKWENPDLHRWGTWGGSRGGVVDPKTAATLGICTQITWKVKKTKWGGHRRKNIADLGNETDLKTLTGFADQGKITGAKDFGGGA